MTGHDRPEVRRAVFDTNVFVAAGFNPRSASARLLEAAGTGGLVLIWNAPTRDETRMVLTRIPRLDWERVAGLFRPENEHPAADDLGPFAFVEDPADRKFAALAVAAEAILISADDHLLSHRDRLPVSSPGAFLRAGGHAEAP